MVSLSLVATLKGEIQVIESDGDDREAQGEHHGNDHHDRG